MTQKHLPSRPEAEKPPIRESSCQFCFDPDPKAKKTPKPLNPHIPKRAPEAPLNAVQAVAWVALQGFDDVAASFNSGLRVSPKGTEQGLRV